MCYNKPESHEHSQPEHVKGSDLSPEMKTSNPTIKIGTANLRLAVNKSVTIPSSFGYHLARGFNRFELCNVSSPGQLGGDAFTEVYFTTISGNLYKIWQPKEPGHIWVLANTRDNKGSGGNLKVYHFPPPEIEKAILEVGIPFHFEDTGASTPVAAILAVNARRKYGDTNTSPELWSDIRNEFDTMVK
jgi:hypothetical protein